MLTDLCCSYCTNCGGMLMPSMIFKCFPLVAALECPFVEWCWVSEWLVVGVRLKVSKQGGQGNWKAAGKSALGGGTASRSCRQGNEAHFSCMTLYLVRWFKWVLVLRVWICNIINFGQTYVVIWGVNCEVDQKLSEPSFNRILCELLYWYSFWLMPYHK